MAYSSQSKTYYQNMCIKRKKYILSLFFTQKNFPIIISISKKKNTRFLSHLYHM